MNDLLAYANDAVSAKDYRSALKFETKAFEETFTITHHNCIRCADLFREIILDTVELQVKDLRRMTTGLFKKRRYESDLNHAKQLYDQLKKSSETKKVLKNRGEKQK